LDGFRSGQTDEVAERLAIRFDQILGFLPGNISVKPRVGYDLEDFVNDGLGKRTKP
jgi:hypothetical protein